MSRPPGKTFADFFPTAPSVLQHRKASKLSQHKTRAEVKAEPAGDAPLKEVLSNTLRGPPPIPLQATKQAARAKIGSATTFQEESETLTGDLLNGVGSASSTSTTSSVFSSNQPHSAMAFSNGIHLHALTPLTSTDFSPPEKLSSPPPEIGVRDDASAISVDEEAEDTAMTPLPTPPARRKTARESGYVVKGSKITYDPDLDKRLGPKEKKKTKAKFVDFGTKAEDEVPPSDPRLAIPNYSRGGGGKQKSKYRPAPYSLRPWPFDAAVSIGPSPPINIVITGFDPMAPVSQISALFSSFGEIAEINNRTDPITGRFLGICGIRYRDCKCFRGEAPVPAVNAAKKAYMEGKKGQRIGLNTIRVDVDREGTHMKRLVEKAIAVQRKESSTATVQKPDITAKDTGPPPTAPKGPSGKTSFRPPAPPPLMPATAAVFSSARTIRPIVKPAIPSLVETTPILDQIKREPYIFIAACYVPVLSTTIPHLEKRLKTYDWNGIRCDSTGYFIIFDNSKRGETESKRCYDTCHMHPLFTYVMNMELQQYGNPNYERSPSPDKIKIAQMPKQDKIRLKRERDMDVEEEKKLRAKDMDPCRAVLQLLAHELRDKLIEDSKLRIAAPALFEYLDPDKHIEKRRMLGIDDPQGTKRQGFDRSDETPSVGTPDSRMDVAFGGRRPLGNKNLNVLSLPRINKRAGFDRGLSGFRDERRKRPTTRPYIRPLFHQLAQFHDEDDSDDEQRTSLTRDTEEQESRPPSRMSMTSVSEDEDELLRKATKRRLHGREESVIGDGILKQEPDTHMKRSADDLVIFKLERSIYEMSPSSRKRKRLFKELEARKRQKEDDELFGIANAELERYDSLEVKMSEAETASVMEATPEVDSDVPKPLAKMSKPKKKTKKQIFEEREAMRRAQMEAEASEVVDEVLEAAEEEELKAELAEMRPEAEWGVSTSQAQCTVQDDETTAPDIDGWEKGMYDDEDVELLAESGNPRSKAVLENLTAWSWKQRGLKFLNCDPDMGVIPSIMGIEGYYVPNPTGSARTQPIKRILESEKSKYLPHRIKVQQAREKREADAKKDPKAAATETAKSLPKASSRGKRVEERRNVKDVEMQKDLLAALSLTGDTDLLRFNQLLKRKKPVRFARSAIHNWGLYSMAPITTGEMIIEYVGERIRQEIADLRERKYTESGIGSSYLFRIDEGSVVDATKRGGIARFINHSCMPNCTAKIIRVDGGKRIVIYALRDINKGESILRYVLRRKPRG